MFDLLIIFLNQHYKFKKHLKSAFYFPQGEVVYYQMQISFLRVQNKITKITYQLIFNPLHMILTYDSSK